jgi:hypothetical protein
MSSLKYSVHDSSHGNQFMQWGIHALRIIVNFSTTLKQCEEIWRMARCNTLFCDKALWHVTIWLSQLTTAWYSPDSAMKSKQDGKLIMVIELSGVQFGLKSNAWLQNRTTAKRECDL